MNKLHPTFNIEEELTIAIGKIGGKRVAEFLGRVPGHENADFYFPSDSVVAELKCLDEDKIHDERIIEKASKIYAEELQSGQAPVIVFGEVQMSTKDFSNDYKEKIGNLYRIPIERLVKKADSQIRSTTSALNLTKAKGLFLLANNNHSALDPQHTWFIVNQILATGKYPCINAAVVFSGNLGAALPTSPKRLDYWIELQRLSMPHIPTAFLSPLRQAWYSHLAKISAETTAPITLHASMEFLSRLESR